MDDEKRKGVNVKLDGVEAESQVGRLAARGSVRKNPRIGRHEFGYESIKGNEFSSTGRFVQKEQVFDRENNLYKEIVIDGNTGEVLHSNEHPLSEHKGHGSAKRKKII